MNEADRTLELSSEELRRLIEAATERILAYIESLPGQPSASPEGGAEAEPNTQVYSFVFFRRVLRKR